MTTIYALYNEKAINATEELFVTMDNYINLEETIIDALAEIDEYINRHSAGFIACIKGFRIEIEGFGEKVIKYEGC